MSKYMNSPNFLWKIKNFMSTEKKVSPAIFMRGLKWQCTFSHFVEAGTEKIHLILECLSECEELSSWKFQVESCHVIVDGNLSSNRKLGTYSLKHKRWCVWSESVLEFRKKYSNYYSDVTFLVTVIPLVSAENLFKGQENVKDVNNDLLCMESLSEDFGKLFNNDEHSDFALKCGEKKFQVHRCVLSTRSEFFAAMLRCNMKEANEGTGQIEDIEPDILELVLCYLYTGKIPELSMESLKKVYDAAERFAMKPLKDKCHSLFVDNFITDSEKEVNKEAETKLTDNVDGEAEDAEAKLQAVKEKQILKELFMTREWGLLSQEFPHKAQKMCEHFLLQKE